MREGRAEAEGGAGRLGAAGVAGEKWARARRSQSAWLSSLSRTLACARAGPGRAGWRLPRPGACLAPPRFASSVACIFGCLVFFPFLPSSRGRRIRLHLGKWELNNINEVGDIWQVISMS